jgi:hypothetical protein
MATYNIGNAQPYATTMAAYADAVLAGDPAPEFDLYGPWTESNQYLGFGLPNITLQAMGGAYVYDGTGATNTWLRTLAGLADSCTVLGEDLIQAKGYNLIGLLLDAASGEFKKLALTENTPTNTFHHASVFGANNLIEDPTMGIIAGAAHDVYGVYNNSTGLIVRRPVIRDIGITTAGKRGYGLSFISTSIGGSAEDFKIYNFTTIDRIYPVHLSGPGAGVAGQVGTICRGEMYDNSAPNVDYGVYAVNGSWRISDLLIRTTNTPTYGFIVGGNFPDPTAGNSWIRNCTVHNMSLTSFFMNQGAGHVWDIQNNIATSSNLGFHSGTPASNLSANNNAFGNVTNYGATWPGMAADTTVDPLYVDTAVDNYRLQRTSPMIDAGIWVSGRTQDLANEPMSGTAMDKGCHEYQQPNPRDVRGTGRRA